MNFLNLYDLCAGISPVEIAFCATFAFVFLAVGFGLILCRIYKNRKAKNPEITATANKENTLDTSKVEEIKKELINTALNSISLEFEESGEYKKGATRFGGTPDVPKDFVWPYFETDTANDNEVKPRPLAFLAQFDLSEISKLDTDELLPHSGTLAFFYEVASMRGGYERSDEGCARVYWFQQWEDLSKAEFPEDLPPEHRFPILGISAKSDKTYIDGEDYYLGRNDYRQTIEAFRTARKQLGTDYHRSCLLGYADVIQGNMTSDCELIARGYNSDEVWNDVNFPADKLEKIEEGAKEWTLLFQLSSIDNKDFELKFGKCGKIYFYIRKEDLRLKHFDRVWLIQQNL